MTARIYFSHGMFFLYDSSERAPGNAWTDEHSSQGFARRPTAANIGTLVEDGCFDVEVGSPELLERCERVVVVSIRSDSGTISISGTDPEDHIVWKGRPGWVRVTVGQTPGGDEHELRLFVVAEEAATDEATRVREGSEWVGGTFIESAEVARY
jgi:hypothetical protein